MKIIVTGLAIAFLPAYDEETVKNALKASGKFILWRGVTISTDGNVI